MKKFCVPIVYKGLSNFIVEANSAGEAMEKAVEEFNNGAMPELLGNEYEVVDHAVLTSIEEGSRKNRVACQTIVS